MIIYYMCQIVEDRIIVCENALKNKTMCKKVLQQIEENKKYILFINYEPYLIEVVEKRLSYIICNLYKIKFKDKIFYELEFCRECFIPF